MVGGRAVSGNALNPRKHRGNTADINTFWSGITPQQIIAITSTPPVVVPLEFFVVGGGGGGAQGFNNGTVAASTLGGSGGGLSQVSTSTTSASSYTITVGTGGSAGGASGGTGGTSSVVLSGTTIASATGGGGSTYGYPEGTAGAVGVGSTANGSAGVNSGVTTSGGTANSFTGTSVTYGAGAGYNASGIGAAGTAETGNGGQGGGGGNPWAGGAGGSGVAYAKFLTSDEGWFSYTGGTRSTTGSYTLIKWGTAGGTLTRNATLPVGAFESIATVTVGAGGSATITFSSIPQTYKHLQIRGISRLGSSTTGTNDIFIRFNSDTATNYSRHGLYGTGSVTGTGGAASQTSAYATRATSPRATSTTNAFGAFVIDILDYANTTKYKTVRGTGGADTNDANGVISIASGNWRSTNAITQIDLTDELGYNFVQYSQFALYGIKG